MSDTPDTVPDDQIDQHINQEIRRLQKSGHSEGCAVGNLLQDGLEDLEGRERLAMALTMLDEVEGWARASQAVLTIVGDFLEPPLQETEPSQLPPHLDSSYQLIRRNRELEQLLLEAFQAFQGLIDDHREFPVVLRMVERIKPHLEGGTP